MDIEVIITSKVTRGLIDTLARFYANELKLDRSKYQLTIFTVPKLAKTENIAGNVTLIGDKNIVLALDSRLNVNKLIETVAHEMVHVKQIVRGQLKQVITRNGRSYYTWMGKRYNNLDYFELPWEIEAYGRQAILANKINKILMKGPK